MTQNPDRRSMLQGLAALFGTSALAACGDPGAPARTPIARGQISYPIGDPRNGAAEGRYTAAAKAFVSRLANAIVPDTDTPGAVAAGVPARLELVLTKWMDREGRRLWLTNLDAVEADLAGRLGEPVASADDAALTQAVAALDEAAFAENSPVAWPYRGLKAEIVGAYYTTEIGCTEELRYEPVPGDWKACVPFSQIGRTWAVG